MRGLRLAVTILGALALAMGVLWLCQGLGIVRWPASSFMIDQRPWVTRGAILAAIGLLVVLGARRIR
jgi:hypothetical protein